MVDPEGSSPRPYTPAHLADRILKSRGAIEGERKQVTVLFCDLANSTALPAGSQQVLCTASATAPTPLVQSQAGLPVPTLSSGTAMIRRFDLAKPDQGVLSRGQAINGSGDYAARILFNYTNTSGVVTPGEGIYLGR